MFITLQLTLPTGPIVRPLKDVLNEARVARNIYPPINDRCKYLALQRTGGANAYLAGTSIATADEQGLDIPVIGDPPLVMTDMEHGSIPLSEMCLYVDQAAVATISVTIIQ